MLNDGGLNNLFIEKGRNDKESTIGPYLGIVKVS